MLLAFIKSLHLSRFPSIQSIHHRVDRDHDLTLVRDKTTEALVVRDPPVHADMAQKERAIAKVTPPATTPGRYRPPDAMLAFLEGL